MSYAILRVQKFHAGDVKGIEIHDRRDKDHSHTNNEIVYERSRDNYDLHPKEGTFRQAIDERISQLQLTKAVRKDAVLMAQVLVTSDREYFDNLSPEDAKAFFQESYDFLKERYGEENVISAIVHMDERTPHMHFNFVPVTEDGKLSARTILNRTDLIKQQDDFYKHVGMKWDLKRGERDGYKTHLEVAEFKKQTAYEEVKRIESMLDDLKKIDTKLDLSAEKGKLMYSTNEVEEIKKQNQSLKAETLTKDMDIQKLNRDIQNLQNELKKAQNDIEGMKPQLERLNDLENEFEGLKGYLEQNTEVANLLKPYEDKKIWAYGIGEKLKSLKQKYSNSRNEHKQFLNKAHDLERELQKQTKNFSKLQEYKDNTDLYKNVKNALETELNKMGGLFKGKHKTSIVEQIKDNDAKIQKVEGTLKSEFNISSEQITAKQKEIVKLIDELNSEKQETLSKADESEKKAESTKKDYKLHKAVSNIQDKPFRNISDRRDNKVKLGFDYDQSLKLNKSDQNWIIDELKNINSTHLQGVEKQFEIENASKSQIKQNQIDWQIKE